MIEYVAIRNFRKHRKRVIRFDPGCTTLIGENDTGKSTVLLAMWWLFTSRPLGMSVISNGRENCLVEIGIDGHVISRFKGRNKPAVYKLDGKVYKAIGNDVPPAIQQLINVADINYQKQVSGPFWLMDSPGQLSKNLNTIVNLEDIDRALANVNGKIRIATTAVDIHKERIATLTDQVDSLAWAEPASHLIVKLQSIQNKLKQTSRRRQALAEAIHRGKTLLTLSERLLGAKKAYARACSLAGSLVDLRERIQLLDRTTSKAHALQRMVNKVIPTLADLNSDQEEYDRLNLSMLHRQQRREDLARFIADCKRFKKVMTKCSERVAKLESKLAKQKRCPLCRQSLSPTSDRTFTYHTSRR